MLQRTVCDFKTKLPFGLADRIVKRFRFRGCKGLIQVYRCPECRQFHVGGLQGWCKEEQLSWAKRVREERRSRRTRLELD
jgi:hypothetical protein